MTLSIAAGIDAGQKFLDVGFAPSGRCFRVPNAPPGIAGLVERLAAAGVRRVVLEAIGPYAQRLTRALSLAGFEVGVVNPRRIKAFRDAEGRRAKTDRLDAGLIARFALVMTDAVRPLPTAEMARLKALSLRRRQLVEMIAMEKTRLRQASEPLLIGSHRAVIAELAAACAEIEAELDRSLAADATAAESFAILTSIPGIGRRIATLLATDLPELGQTDRKAIASLAGLAPHVSQSGNAPPRAAIAGGRPCVRAALYMAALVAVRHDPQRKAEYTAMRSAGKPAKLALVAIARKILVTANALVKARRAFQKTTEPLTP
jgi:transposase